MKKWTIVLVLLYILLLVGGIILFNRNKIHIDPDISRRYELQIDSIKREIFKREALVDSLDKIIITNDSIMSDLRNYITLLQNERINIRNNYESRNKELENMSNDSIVMYVREQLRLWADW